jgi:putative spermidine/putrescine transport system ATP-binding protein
MVYSPRVLLMDEPLGALDKKLRESLQLEIKRIHAELGTTFVYVTHDQEEALVLSNRIAVFNEGRIEQVGTADELYETPTSVFVAEFLGESTLLHGTARRDGEETVLTTLGTTVRARRGQPPADGAGAVLVRPERIAVLPGGDPAPAGNALAGRIVQDIYVGNARKLEVALADGTTARVRETAGAASDCHTGDEVWLTFDAEAAVALPDGRADVPTTPEEVAA